VLVAARISYTTVALTLVVRIQATGGPGFRMLVALQKKDRTSSMCALTRYLGVSARSRDAPDDARFHRTEQLMRVFVNEKRRRTRGAREWRRRGSHRRRRAGRLLGGAATWGGKPPGEHRGRGRRRTPVTRLAKRVQSIASSFRAARRKAQADQGRAAAVPTAECM